MNFFDSLYKNRDHLVKNFFCFLEAMLDLNLAIEISNGQGKAGVRALCQRGILLKMKGNLDDARSDFSKAAKGGSKFAKSQLVELNPYAAMCNQMLKEITRLN